MISSPGTNRGNATNPANLERGRALAKGLPAAVPPRAEARPTYAAPARATEVNAARPDYDAMIGKLEPFIAAEAERMAKELEAKKLTACDATMIFGIDITGTEVSVCLACGRLGHDYQPTMMRMSNPSIDMMTESVAVFMEASARVGVRFGVFAYDDAGALIIRYPCEESAQGMRAEAADRFQKFKDRFGTVSMSSQLVSRDGVVRDTDWLAAQAARWKPTDAGRFVVGRSDDQLASRTIVDMAATTPQAAIIGALLMKSTVPAASLRGVEAALAAKHIHTAGLAVGANATTVKRSFFQTTTIATDLHEARSVQSDAIGALLASIGVRS